MSSVTEDIIDEDLDEFLNSSISASEDFTKEETVTDDSASLKADYVEKLWSFSLAFLYYVEVRTLCLFSNLAMKWNYDYLTIIATLEWL